MALVPQLCLADAAEWPSSDCRVILPRKPSRVLLCYDVTIMFLVQLYPLRILSVVSGECHLLFRILEASMASRLENTSISMPIHRQLFVTLTRHLVRSSRGGIVA